MTLFLKLYPGDAIVLATINVLAQIAVVVLLAWTIALFFTRHRAAARHGIWLAALGCVFVCPIAAYVAARADLSLVSLRLAALPSPFGRGAGGEGVNDEDLQNVLSRVISPHPNPLPKGEGTIAKALPKEEGIVTKALPKEEGTTASSLPETVATIKPNDQIRAWLGMAVVFWAVGVLYFLVRLLHGWWNVLRLQRRLKFLDEGSLDDVLREVRRALNVKNLPRLASWQSDELAGPLTIGVFRPVVILPENLIEKLDYRGLRDVLIHEFAHAVRRDPLVGFLQRLAAILYWPYPPVHFLNRQLAAAREEVCDNYVLQQGDAPRYAKTLLTISQSVLSRRLRPASLGLLHPHGKLEHRVARLLDHRRNVMVRMHRVTWVVLTALFLTAVVVVAGTRLLQAEPPHTPPPAPPAAPANSVPGEHYSDIAIISYSGESLGGQGSILWPTGYTVVTLSESNATKTEVAVSFIHDNKASDSKQYHLVAVDKKHKRHEPVSESSAMGGGVEFQPAIIRSEFSLPQKEIMALVVQRSVKSASGIPSAQTSTREQPPQEPYRIQPLDIVKIQVLGYILDQPIDGYYLVEPDGQVALGPAYGRANVKGLTMEQAEENVAQQLKKILAKPDVQVTMAGKATQWHNNFPPPTVSYTVSPGDLLFIGVLGTILDQPINGIYKVEPTGTVPLGPAYGRAKVEGLTLQEAEKAIQKKLSELLAKPDVQVTFGGWEGVENVFGRQVGPTSRFRLSL